MFGFVNDTYEAVEEARIVTPSVALIDGDFDDLTITLMAGINDDSESSTAIGMHNVTVND